MIKIYILNYFRSISKNKLLQLLNILGFTIGLACGFYNLSYILYELSFDKFFKDSERIYKILNVNVENGELIAVTPYILGETLKDNCGEVEGVVRLFTHNFVPKIDKRYISNQELIFCDSGIISFFDLKLIKGNPQKALSAPNSLILSESMAKKYFGENDPLGEIIQINDSTFYKIAGVFEDIPKNSHLKLEFLTSYKNFTNFFGKGTAEFFQERWDACAFFTYIKLFPNSDLSELEKKLPNLISEKAGDNASENYKYSFQKFDDIHLYSADITWKEDNAGDINTIYGMILVIIIIVAIVFSNYIVLTISTLSTKVREIGLRKTLGASTTEIIKQNIVETLLILLISLILSVGVCFLIYPLINEYVTISYSFLIQNIFYFIIVLLETIIMLGTVLSLVTLFFVKRIAPNVMIQQFFAVGKKSKIFKNIVLSVQLLICFVIFLFTLIVYKQINYIKNTDLGFEKENLLTINVSELGFREQFVELKDALMANPSVAGVARSTGIPPQEGRNTGMEAIAENGNLTKITTKFFGGDYNFAELLKLRLIAGRFFDKSFLTDSDALIVNEAFVNSMGWKEPIGKEVQVYLGAKKYRIIGVVKNFNVRSLHVEIEPTAIFLNYPNFYERITLRLKSNADINVIESIKELWNKFYPNHLFVYSFVDDDFNSYYKNEEEQAKLFIISCVISIFLVSIGLFSIAMFNIETKTKEMGIRKVLGASTSSLLIMHSKHYLTITFISCLLAVPLSYSFINSWLERFAYKASITISEIFVSFSFIFLITYITVLYHVVKSSILNPSDVLRGE